MYNFGRSAKHFTLKYRLTSSTIYSMKPSFVISNEFTDENLPLQIVI